MNLRVNTDKKHGVDGLINVIYVFPSRGWAVRRNMNQFVKVLDNFWSVVMALFTNFKLLSKYMKATGQWRYYRNYSKEYFVSLSGFLPTPPTVFHITLSVLLTY